MQEQKITVKYPPLIKWLRELDRWVELAKRTTGKKATCAIWGEHPGDVIEKWIERGTALMSQCNPDATDELLHWIKEGIIDPEYVAAQLKLQNWDYVVRVEHLEKEDDQYFPLNESWDTAVGSAMVISKAELPFGGKSKDWLLEGMRLFYISEEIDDTESTHHFVDESHEHWLRQLCEKAPWAREVVVGWILENGINNPEWSWCFSDSLGNAPSVDFIQSVICQIDWRVEQFANPRDVLLLDTFRARAPVFFAALQSARKICVDLYGDSKDPVFGQSELDNGQIALIHSMFPQAMKTHKGYTDMFSNKPSIGRLFETDAPSNAV